MCKRVACLLAAAVMMLTGLPFAHAKILRFAVIYDGQASNDAERSGAVEYLRDYALYASWQCDFINAWSSPKLDGYDAYVLSLEDGQKLPHDTAEALISADKPVFVVGGGGLEQLCGKAVYRKGDVLVRLNTESGKISEMLLDRAGIYMLPDQDSRALGGQVIINGEPYALCQTVDNITHFAYFNGKNDLLCALLADCLQLWQWPFDNAPTAYGQYLVLENAYPFIDPKAISERADLLRDSGMPFVISVTGLYGNADHPSMKRFCEVLRYEQSRGTGIIMRVPFVTLDRVDIKSLLKHMSIAYEGYSSYGVYPAAVQVPKIWLQSEKGLEALRGFRTLFLFDSVEVIWDAISDENAAYRDGHQIIAPAYDNRDAFTASYAQAVYVDAMTDMDELRTIVKRFKSGHRVFKSLSDVDNVVYIGDYAVFANSGGVIVNGARVDLRFEPFTYEDDYQYDRGFVQYMKNEIETMNGLLIFFVLSACAIFSVMMYLFRKQARRDLILGKKPKRGRNKPAHMEHSIDA